MSYCVNCGVELDLGAARCPLCGTPAWKPDPDAPSYFPTKPAEVPPASRRAAAALLTAMLASVSLCCGVLNLLLPTERPWSLYVIGAAVMLWIWFVLPMLARRIPIFFRLTADVAAVGVYVFLISIDLSGGAWFRGLALPILGWACVLVFLLSFLLRGGRRSRLSAIAMCIGTVGLMALGVEYCMDRFSARHGSRRGRSSWWSSASGSSSRCASCAACPRCARRPADASICEKGRAWRAPCLPFFVRRHQFGYLSSLVGNTTVFGFMSTMKSHFHLITGLAGISGLIFKCGQFLDFLRFSQDSKLILSDLPQRFKPLFLLHSTLDQLRIMCLQIGENGQFGNGCVITDVAVFRQRWISFTLRFRRAAKQRHIQQVCLIRICQPFRVFRVVALRQDIIFHSIRVDQVIVF